LLFNFHGQHDATEEMGANRLCKVPTAPRAQVRSASAEDVCGKLPVPVADVTDGASDNDMIRTVKEDKRTLLPCEDVRLLAVNVRQMTVTRL
jgi:hypothetical protein